MSACFISIGMPVYNGGEALRRALDCLLSQTHANFELIISDNASTDLLTQSITEEYARRDSRIRLTRQSVNQGPFENFLWVLEQAQGEYFLWAAHDDCWSSNYLEVLANRLDQSPGAVLASPRSEAEVTSRNGVQVRELVPAAPNGDRDETLRAYIHQHKCCLWIYGMYRTKWLQTAAPEWKTYPWYSGDVVWLWGVILTQQIVGDSAATFFYTADHRLRKKQTYRQTVEMWGTVFFHMVRLSWQRLPARHRVGGVFQAAEYVFRHHVQRQNVLLTAVRLVKLITLWCWIGMESVIRRIAQRCMAVVNPNSRRAGAQSLQSLSAEAPQETRRAA